MPQPTKSAVHVNRPLTNISIAYIQNPNNFIAEKVFPSIGVAKASDTYFKYDKDSWFRDEMKQRAPSTESAGSGYTIDNTPSYNCKNWALHKDIDDDIRANEDAPLNSDREATLFLTQKGLLKKEKEFVSNYFKTGIWTGSATGSDIDLTALKWSNSASDPVKDIDTQKAAMIEKTGFEPNTLVVPLSVHNILKNHPDIRDRIKYVQKAVVTEDILAMLFGVEKYLVAKATNNTAIEGAAATMASVFTPNALLAYSAPTPSIMVPSAGYVFNWTEYSSVGARIKKFRMENVKSDRIEIETSFDMKQVAADLGAYFINVI